MATHSSILAWRIPGTEEHGVPQYLGSQRMGQTGRLTLSLSNLHYCMRLPSRAKHSQEKAFPWKKGTQGGTQGRRSIELRE